MKKIDKKYIIPILLVAVILIIKFAILDNVFILMSFAKGLDEPSSLFYLTTERIYKLSAKKSVSNKIIEHIEENKDNHIQDLFIRTLGIIGRDDPRAITCIIKNYIKYQDNMNRQNIVLKVIDAMGYISNKNTVSILERLLINYDKHRMVVPRYSIARSLYLSTGKNYEYINESGTKTQLRITEELSRAREIIVDSKGRFRKFQEMIILDNLNRADHYKVKIKNQPLPIQEDSPKN